MEKKLTGMQGLNGSTLKTIAMITMMIDHIGAFLLLYATALYHQGTDLFPNAQMWYQVTRQIGRTAFPLFCFLLVEGFVHTRDSSLYLARLMVFALLSEIPFDLAVSNKMISWKNQNVFFTLALGLGMMIVLRGLERYREKKGKKLSFWGLDLPWAGVALAFVIAAELIECDYGGYGILLIAIFYCTRKHRLFGCMVGYLVFLWEPFCLPAFLLILFYNGQRGKQMKYLFYAFYPVHLLVLVWIRNLVF